MKLSLVYMTGRKEPHLEWTLDGLADQRKDGDEIQLIVIDALNRKIEDLCNPDLLQGTPIKIVSVCRPKPNIWQGPNRITDRDWWATANARNTGICLAHHDYISFLDDRCWLGPNWLETLRKGERERKSVIVGSYDKIENGFCEGGSVTPDHRRGLCPNGKIDCGGGWLYGCTFALPLEWCLEVNGLEEGCDGLTGEDYIFGLMLGNAGHRIDFCPSLFVKQDRAMGTEHGFAMTDKGKSPNDKSHAALARFGKRSRTEFTPDLREIRKSGVFPDIDPSYEYRDWYDGQLIKEIKTNG